jgi:hypothetical protein
VPTAPAIPCRRCGAPSQGRCIACSKVKNQRIDDCRGTSTQRGYGPTHRRLRISCFIRDNWTCVDCGWQPSIVADFALYQLGEPPLERILAELTANHNAGHRHLHADHQIPIEERRDLRLDLRNYRTRCNLCHSAKTMRESVARP